MTYRVIQWMTGDVGQVGVRHFAENLVFDLVGVLVHTPEKVGKDAGEIAGMGPIGVTATGDVESVSRWRPTVSSIRPSSWMSTPSVVCCGRVRTSSPRAASSI